MKQKLIRNGAVVLAIVSLAALECAAQSPKNPVPSRASTSGATSPGFKQKIAEEYGKLPLSFEANRGQTDPQVKFLSRGAGYQLFLLPNEAVLTLEKARAPKEQRKPGDLKGLFDRPGREMEPPAVICMMLLGAGRGVEVTGLEQQTGKSNYFIGNDPTQWRTNLPNYAKVHYHGVYPGVDLVYHGNQQQLEYDFVVAPGADPRKIALRMKGAKRLELNADGDLVLHTSAESVRLRKPVIYQESGGLRTEVAGGFVLAAKNTVKFRIGKYDSNKPLIIDPVLSYSTFLGGTNFDEGAAIAVDSFGNAYVTGDTRSTDFPLAGAEQAASGGVIDAFVSKLNSAGTVLLYSTYLGGNNEDFGIGIAVNSFGNAYVTGQTCSTNFPVVAAIQGIQQGECNAFVTELDPTGSTLVFSTYLGGKGGADYAAAIAVDFSGNAYVTGQTTADNFPVMPSVPLQSFLGGGMFNSIGGANTWGSLQNGLTTHNFDCLVRDKSTAPSTVYACGDDSGVFKLPPDFTAWTPLNSGLTNPFARTLVIDPTSTSTIYAGTSDGGIFKSTNGAGNWTQMNSGLLNPGVTGTRILALTMDPNNPSILYAAPRNGGVFQTTNGAATWSSFNNSLTTNRRFTALAVDPNASLTTVYGGSFIAPAFVTKFSPSGSRTISPITIAASSVPVKAAHVPKANPGLTATPSSVTCKSERGNPNL